MMKKTIAGIIIMPIMVAAYVCTSQIHGVKRKILANILIMVVLLSGLFVFPASAVDSWSKSRPSDETPYCETIGNAYTNCIASVGMGVHIGTYHENDPVFGDFLTLRASVSANTRVGIKYDIKPYSYGGWFEVSNPTGITSDNSGVNLTLPFTILYYGVYYEHVWVCDNGFLSFDSNSISPTPQDIPNTNKPNSLIAPFWRDLDPDPSKGGSITYGTIGYPPDDAFVISWNEVPNKANGVKQSFQVIIHRIAALSQPYTHHNRVFFQYNSITKDPSIKTVVGVEDIVGDRGSSYDYNTLTNNSALEVRYPVSGYRLERLRIKLSKSDTYAKIGFVQIDGYNEVGGYNVILQNPEENPFGDLFVDAIGFAAQLLVEKGGIVAFIPGGGIGFGIMLITLENAFKLAGALSEPVFGVKGADVNDTMAYVTSEAMSEECCGKPFDATLSAGIMWFFTDPNVQSHQLTITAELEYLELHDDMVYDYYTISTSVSLNMGEPTLGAILDTLGFANLEESTVETFAPGTYRITLYAELAGYHASNELSWYPVGTTQYNLIFNGPEGNFGYVNPPITKYFTTNSQFGLSFLSPEARYFTETSKNPDGIKHAMIYRNLDNPKMYLIGFEDQLGGGDKDYTDMVISLERFGEWVNPSGFEDPDSYWSDEPSAYDDNTSSRSLSITTCETCNMAGYLILLLDSAIQCDKIRIFLSGSHIDDIEIDVYKDGAWESVLDGGLLSPQFAWREYSFAAGSVEKARIRFHTGGDASKFWIDYMRVHEFDFWKTV